MTVIASNRDQRADSIVALALSDARVTLGFRTALFDACARAGVTAHEFLLTAGAEKLRAAGADFSGVFRPGDLPTASQR